MKIIKKFNALKMMLKLSIFILTLFLGIVCLTNNSVENNEVDSASSEIKVTVVPKSNYNGEAYPIVSNGICSKSVIVVIKLSKPATESITVYYKTFDSTASCEIRTSDQTTADYTAVDSSIIFNANESQREISISVNSEPFPVYDTNADYTGSNATKEGGWYGRYFYFQIYKVVGKNASIDTSNSEVKCHLAYDYIYAGSQLKDQTNKYLNMLSGYSTSESWTETYCQDCPNDGDYYTMASCTVVTQEQIDYAIKTDLGRCYVTSWGRVFDTSSRQEDMTYYFKLGNTTVADCRLDGYLGRLPFFSLKPDDWDDIDFGKAGSKDVLTGWSYSNRDYEDSNNYYLNQTEAIENAPDSITVPKCITRSGYYWYLLGKTDTTASMVEYTEAQNFGRGIRNWYISYAICDTVRPYIVAYWCDKQINLNSNKIQMMVRFNQPCTISDSNKLPQIVCNIGGLFASNKLTFTYVGGDGSDTFVFEADLSTCNVNEYIKQLTPDTINNAEYIVDASGYHNALGTNDGGQFDFSKTIPSGQQLSDLAYSKTCQGLTIDPRTPKITSDSTTTETATKTAFTIKISTNSFDGSTGKFYYCWSNDCNNTDDIVREGDFVELTNGQASDPSSPGTSNWTYTVSNSDLTGLRFLWVKAVSRLGKVDAKIIGPYKFDNTAESVTDLKYQIFDGTTFSDATYDIGGTASQNKYITFTIDYSDSYYTASTLYSYDLVWATDEVWNDKTTIHYNANDDITSSHFWVENATINEANPQIKVLRTDTTTYTKLDFAMNTLMDSNNNVVDKYQRSTFESEDNTIVTAITKIVYGSAILYSNVNINTKNNPSELSRKFYLGIKLTDKLGNTKEEPDYDYIHSICYMDSRNLKSGDWNFASTARKAINDDTYLIYSTTSAFSFVSKDALGGITYDVLCYVKKSTDDEKEYLLDTSTNKFKDSSGLECEYFDITYNSSDGKTFSFTPRSSYENLPGYYSIYIIFKEKPAEAYWSYTQTFEFYYVTKDSSQVLTFTDTTNNVSQMLEHKVLINKIYSINLSAKFYYKDALNTIQYETYSTGSPLSFSDTSAAENYLRYMEYQDLMVLKLDNPSIVSSLNNGSSGYNKASGYEQVLAREGQTWIRYKRATWSSESATDSNWVYYYYSDELEDSIDLNSLDGVLQLAITQVISQIMKTWGSYTYLNTEFGLSKDGAPELNGAAIKYDAQTLYETRCLNKIKNGYVYNGDSSIYSNQVSYNNVQYVLASTYNITFTDKTIIYMAKYEGKDIAWDNYTKLQPNDETMLKNIITQQGVYRFIEIDENGAQSCMVYIDNEAPTVMFTYESKTTNGGTETKIEYTNSSLEMHTLYGTECTLGVITDEIDTYSHVTIYYAKTGFVYKTYTMEELAANEGKIVLGNNRYNVEVYDRSGNHYTVGVYMNSTDLVCTIKENKNKNVTFIVGDTDNPRTKADIYTYEIRFNGEQLPIANTYAETRTYDQAGVYEWWVVDYYGNEYYGSIDFEREVPELSWIYYNESRWSYYDTTKIQDMYVENMGSQVYNVVTSKKIGFEYTGSFELQVVNADDESIVYTSTSQGSTGTFKFNETSNFNIKVSYVKYPEVYAIYHIIFDSKAPDVIATYTEYVINNIEEYDVASQVSDTVGLKKDDIITPTTVSYSVSSTYDKKIALNGKISARAVKLAFDDDNEIYQISIVLDGETLVETTEIQESYTFEQYGKYVVTAIDRLNNKGIFTFTNSEQTDYDYSVDDVQCVTPLSSLEYMDENYNYTKVEYGNTSLEYKVPNVGAISMLLTNGDSSLYFRYKYENESLKKYNYVVTYCYDDKQLDEDGNVIAEYTLSYEEVEEKEVFYLGMVTGTKKDGTLDGTVKVNKWYQIANVEDDGVAIYAKFDENNDLFIKVEASNFEQDNFDIQVKITPQDRSEPFFARVGLSKKKSDIDLENEDGVIETNHSGESIYVNGAIKIEKTDFDTQEITKIQAAYSVDNKFDSFITIYENGEFIPYVLEYEGFYKIIIDNIYGNQTIYNIALSNNCLVVLEMIYYDSYSNTYTSTYPSDYFYSNDQAKIDVYSYGLIYTVTKDGVDFTPTVTQEDTHLGITLTGNGSYIVNIQDIYGNTFVKYIEIEYKTLTLSDDILTGFNDKALLRSENYTNRKISVDYNALQMSDFEYICVYKDNNVVNAVYDLLAENKIELDTEKLNECVGNDGDGLYRIDLRDKFGNLASANITYSATPTIEITRQSRTELAPIAYDLEQALENGAYSNNIVTILSNSSCYTFSVNGNQSKIPYTFEFSNNSITEGTRDFDVYYLDEYGFEYSFNIHLLRTTIDFDPIKFGVVTIDEKQYTQDYLSLTYASDYTCSYTLNGGDSVNYPSGIIVNDDGDYVFTLTDIAGNVCYYVITKDTIVEYAFTGNISGTEYISSSVVNSENVNFAAKNKDSAEIAQVFLNGEEITDYDSKQITGDGKWEFLIKDAIGNTSVYTLYIITHSLNRFAYTCPKNYQIVDVRYDSGNGQSVDNLSQVVDYTSFDFSQDGEYKVTIQSTITNEITKFEFEISNVPPQAVLDGATDGESTIDNVVLKGTVKGDVIYIYKDGKLDQTFEVTTDGQSPEIEEKGSYKVVIKNLAGNTTEYTFTKKYVANTAGSVLIMVVVVALGLSLFVGVCYRNKSKVDK